MDSKLIISLNDARDKKFSDKSFMGKLHEDYIWDIQEYQKLEAAIFHIGKDLSKNNSIPRSFAYPIFDIFGYVMFYYGCHFNKNDGYVITNITDDELNDFIVRYKLLMTSIFSGDILDMADFKPINPLLKNG